jgi:hypothetical protein
MLSIINRLRPPQPQLGAAAGEAELLAQLGPNVEDPEELRRELAAFEEQRIADDAQWERLDRQHSPRAAYEQTAIQERLRRLQAQIDALRPRIAVAEARRAAFLELTRLLADTDETITAQAADMYAHALVSSEAERREQRVALDAQIRLRGRLAAALASVSSARRFHRGAPDPFGNLRADLLARVAELDRFRAPGSARPSVPWPPRAQQLIDVLTKKGVPT